jgi:hypothetical protein
MKPWVAIPLAGSVGKGRYVLVDADDLPAFEGVTWRVSDGYAEGGVLVEGKRRPRKMHRILLGAEPGQFVDHINGNKLDNRRCNLCFATKSQNAANYLRRAREGHYRGVIHLAVGYAATCTCRGETRRGWAETIEEAAQLYDEFARDMHGEFAVLNFPRAGERGASSTERAA